MRRFFLALIALAVIAAFVATQRGQKLSVKLPAIDRVLGPLSDKTSGNAPAFDGTIPAATAAAETPQESPEPPVVAAGAAVTIRLSEAPAKSYLRAKTGGNERFYRRLLVKAGGRNARLSPDLGRAAREFVFQYTELGREPPSDVREFLIRSSGAVAGDTAFRHVRTTDDAASALQKAIRSVLRDPPDGAGTLFVGIGEVFTPGARYKRHIGVVSTRLPVLVDPAPRTVQPGDTWTISGRLLANYRGLKVLVLRPDGSVDSYPPRLDGGRFTIDVACGDDVGALDMQLVGTGPYGPGKLFQLRVEVGREVPETLVATLPPDESRLQDVNDAAALAFKLLNDDRVKHGLHALQWDGALATVAESHSRDMRDGRFFAHLSPTTGLHSDRLRKAGYKSISSAENLAHNVSIAESQRGLMASLGHRRNILSKDSTHVGIGVVGEEREDGSRRWWVTQLFARPPQELDPDEAIDRLLQAIGRERERAGLKRLVRDGRLDTVADDHAQRVAANGLSGASQAMIDAAKNAGLVRGRLRAWAATTPEVSRLKLPRLVRAPAARRIGIGVAPARGDDVRIGVTLLIGD